ncbi:interleukin-18 [Fundulus heteroclitus]|uniref:interleukin-18 n=1 Tax=Fundulus heteroclitus TaxID=8078 RepID=UPI00165C54D2|nr:interleukin-18 [Fundulus heteroclitus]
MYHGSSIYTADNKIISRVVNSAPFLRFQEARAYLVKIHAATFSERGVGTRSVTEQEGRAGSPGPSCYSHFIPPTGQRAAAWVVPPELHHWNLRLRRLLMATSEDAPLEFSNTCEDSFYFLDTECASCTAPLVEDSFRKSNQSPKTYWIQSMDQKFLVLKTSGEFEFENRTVDDQEQSDCKFGLQIYQNSISDRGQPVMLYVCIDGQKMMVSCKNNKEVFPEPMDPKSLENINGTGHKALFQWKKISTDKYKFESTMYTGHFLAFEPSDMPCLHKLILRQASKDEVDEPTVIGVKHCSL